MGGTQDDIVKPSPAR